MSKKIRNYSVLTRKYLRQLEFISFRKVMVNLLVRQEYSTAHVARLVIEPTAVVLGNANRTYHSGPIDPNNFTPYPKNPNIANFFREIELMDRLGSGVRNVTRYVQPYPQRTAEFREGDIFRTVVPRQYVLAAPTGAENTSGNVVASHDSANVPDDSANFTINGASRTRLTQILYAVQSGLR